MGLPVFQEVARFLVTLFEGEPYSLWNIRDLARHCGLQVIESFRFPWSQYPGYQHARTIGDIKTGIDRSTEGKRKGAWRGEEEKRELSCSYLKKMQLRLALGKMVGSDDGHKQIRLTTTTTATSFEGCCHCLHALVREVHRDRGARR